MRPHAYAPYLVTRKVIYFLAGVTLIVSSIVGLWVFNATQGSPGGDFSAAGQVAAVVPGFAGVVLAAFALSAYMREEDDILKLAEKAWIGRNRFLHCSQYLYYTIDSDLGQSRENLTSVEGTRETLILLFPEFQSSLMETELSRAMTQKEIEKGGDGSESIFAVRGFFEQVRYFMSADESKMSAFEDQEPEGYDEMSEEDQLWTTPPKQDLDMQIWNLVKNWSMIAKSIEEIDSVEKFEFLLRHNYQYSLRAKLDKLIEEHGLAK